MNRRFIARRLLGTIPTVLAVLVTGWLLVHLAPGDPVLALAGEHGDAEYYAFMRHRFGLDLPLPQQLATYLRRAAAGDLGTSYVYGRGTLDVIMERAPATLLLTLSALLVSLVIALPLGALAASRPQGARDAGITAATLLLFSAPTFWVAQVALLSLGLQLGAFPVQGMRSADVAAGGWPGVVDVLSHLVLPVLVLAAQEVAVLVRVTRTALVEELSRDHVRTARAKGLGRVRTLLRHAMPRALMPVVTVVGGRVGHLVAGASVVEIVFGWPGMGRLLVASLQARDTPILLGLFLVVSLSVVVANLLCDLVHAALDPRIALR